jgi:hypothetical protein
MSHLTVFFDDPWWVAVIEFEADGLYFAVRHLFGSSEPSGAEVYDFVRRDLARCLTERNGGEPVMAQDERPAIKALNPKRAARLAARASASQGISTKAQQAIKAQQEANKQEHRADARIKREQLADYKRQRAAAKAHARHRGH